MLCTRGIGTFERAKHNLLRYEKTCSSLSAGSALMLRRSATACAVTLPAHSSRPRLQVTCNTFTRLESKTQNSRPPLKSQQTLLIPASRSFFSPKPPS